MSYRINKTDGSLLVELVDGIIDTATTDLSLVGKNYKGYGEAFYENFVALLENFAATSAPANPLKGQLWYDTSDNRLKLYNGTTFRIAGGPIVAPDRPANPVEGDLWIDNNNRKFHMYDGTAWTEVGPSYTSGQGKTGLEAYTMVDTSGQARIVIMKYIGGVLAGIYSRQEFTPASSYVIAPYEVGRAVKIGFNPVYTDDFKYHGTATNAENLVDTQGNTFSSVDFVRTNERDDSLNAIEQSMIGNLFVKGSSGVKIGVGSTDYAHFKVISGTTKSAIETVQTNYDLALRVRKGSDQIDAILIDTSESKVGIFNSTPSYTLDVTGTGHFTSNVIIDGDLTVKGDSSYFNVSTLRVEDPNIELGLLDDSTEGDDTNADGGGITLRSTNGSKDLHWIQATSSWTSNQHFNLRAGKEYRIDDTTILTKTRIGTTVTSALGLTQIGTLTSLSILNDLTLTGNIVNSGAMNIDTGGTITFSGVRLNGVDTPTAADDATTKAYVDNLVATIPTNFSLDITGLSNPNPPGTGQGPLDDVKAILTSIAPVGTPQNGSIAKVHCTSYTGATVTGIPVTVTTDPDSSGTLMKSYTNAATVQPAGNANDVGSESVVSDIAAANTTSGAVTLVPDRYTMTFEVQSGAWVHTGTANYP